MGEVYRARDTRLGRSVAIKILPAQFSSDAAPRQRFEREAKTISQLNHPHICVLQDVGRQDGIDYLVMECVEGETLATRLAIRLVAADAKRNFCVYPAVDHDPMFDKIRQSPEFRAARQGGIDCQRRFAPYSQIQIQ